MRVSVDKADPAYMEPWDAGRLRVLFNGVEHRRVITADEEAGTVLVYALDQAGYPRVSADGSTMLTELLRGEVRIERMRAAT